MTTQLGLDGSEIIPTELERKTHRVGKPPLTNPLLPIFGPSDVLVVDAGAGKGRSRPAVCGDCSHLIARRLSRTYYKCELRSTSGSASTDHRVGWPACGRFDPYVAGGVEVVEP